MERVLLFSVISLVGFVRDVERNRAHNPTILARAAGYRGPFHRE